jgi:type II secretory pathway component PulK
MQRTPQRISVTISWQLHQRLLQRSDAEGRSLSNLAAFLLEKSSGQSQ